jgi:hypothetical protein
MATIKSEFMSKDLGCKWNFIVRNEASQEQGRESNFDGEVIICCFSESDAIYYCIREFGIK